MFYILEGREKKYNEEEVNIDAFATKKLNAYERKKLERDLAITLLGGYKCKYCGKELEDSDDLDLHHGVVSFSDMQKENPELKRHETPWHIINQTAYGRGVAILCPKCHRKITAEERIKKTKANKIAEVLEDDKEKTDMQRDLFNQKEIEKARRMSEKRIDKKEEIASLFKKAITPEDYKSFVENLHKRQVYSRTREIMNSNIIHFIKNQPKEFSKLYSKKRDTIENSQAKEDFNKEIIQKIKNRILYYYKNA